VHLVGFTIGISRTCFSHSSERCNKITFINQRAYVVVVNKLYASN